MEYLQLAKAGIYLPIDIIAIKINAKRVTYT
jgi:hypothetical protein